MDIKIIPIKPDVDEIQIQDEHGNILGAGAWTTPYDFDIAVKSILDVCMGRYAMA